MGNFMFKKVTLYREMQIFLLFVVLTLILIIPSLFAMNISSDTTNFKHQLDLFIVFLITAVVELIWFLVRIVPRFMNYINLCRRFSDGEIYQDYIDGIEGLFPYLSDDIRRLDQLIDRQNTMQLSTKQAEFLALQNQINPHFLYNTLESITWMVEAQENEGAVRMISELAKLLRVSLSRGKTIISIKDELQHSRSYMNIQLARYKERFKTEFRIEKEIENYCIVKLVIQPILENAIYYGVGNMDEDEDGRIIVSGEKKEEDILITIEDNGMGMPEEVLEKILTDNSKVPKHGSGVGVINVHSRIRLMFGEKYGLSIESEPDEGTRVTIRIPAIPYTPENAERLESQKYIQRRSADEKEPD